jgi:uncharacterized protein
MPRQVEIIFSPYAGGDLFQEVVPFHSGMTVLQALNLVRFYERFPEAQSFSVSVFSKKVTLDTPLSVGDRVEICRPLRCNPKERRRKQALSSQSLS